MLPFLHISLFFTRMRYTFLLRYVFFPLVSKSHTVSRVENFITIFFRRYLSLFSVVCYSMILCSLHPPSSPPPPILSPSSPPCCSSLTQTLKNGCQTRLPPPFPPSHPPSLSPPSLSPSLPPSVSLTAPSFGHNYFHNCDACKPQLWVSFCRNGCYALSILGYVFIHFIIYLIALVISSIQLLRVAPPLRLHYYYCYY